MAHFAPPLDPPLPSAAPEHRRLLQNTSDEMSYSSQGSPFSPFPIFPIV
jgi:hypothetical protein